MFARLWRWFTLEKHMHREAVERYRRGCEGLQEYAEQRLGRSLTAEESDKLWSIGSFMGLEAIESGLYYSTNTDEAESVIAGLPECEPIPEEWTKRA